MSNVREIPLEQDKMLGVAEQLKRQQASMAAAFDQLALSRKAFYDAHITAGFSPEQAMRLTSEYGNPSNKV